MNNYVPYHVHTMLSNCTTNIDSVTRYGQYTARAQELGMKAFGFSEHGNIFEWLHKKEAVEQAGMKYLHGVEAYITMHPEEKVRDNYHTILYARNYDGFLELNRLVSGSFERKETTHFYYTPRIFMDDLERTSGNILVTSACLGGALNGKPEDEQRFLRFMRMNKGRCWLEIQHHLVAEQAMYNQKLWDYSKRFGIPLIAGTDSHALNETHARGRVKLQQGKNVRFSSEEDWNLCFMSYEELCDAYRQQNALPEEVWLDAIEETNAFADQIEPFAVDRSIKYPNVFADPVKLWRDEVYQAAENHPYAMKRHGREALFSRLDEELAVFEKCGASPYMALKYHQHMWEKEHGIQTGYGRGSVTGSMCAYVTGITDVDSMEYGLNFFRFMNPERVSLADIDVDYAEADREKAKRYLLDEKMGFQSIQTAEIITFNTIATKGAIRDIARADGLPLAEVDKLTKQVEPDGSVPEQVRAQYSELFEYVDIVTGTVVSYGSHPCGVLVTDHDIAGEIGLCTSSGSDYQITCLNMKELDSLNLVKMDELGLDSNDLINRACTYAGIDRLTPDNMDMEDAAVWQSFREDTTCIFQFESDMATAYLRRFLSPEIIALAKKRNPHFRMIDWFAFASGLLRPGSASYRDQVADGMVRDNGSKALNAFLADEAGFCTYQESIIRFLELFCGYSGSEADNVRRAIAKKKGTETLLPEIERRFIEYAPEHYDDISPEKAKEIIKPFIQTILDASSYSFSRNHALAYAMIGYVIGYLRYHYPMQFVAAALNVYADKEEKTAAVIAYARNHGVSVSPPRWGHSRADYMFDNENGVIYKGLQSIKHLNADVADQLYEAAQGLSADASFMDVLNVLNTQTGINSLQLDILIQLDFFAGFGNPTELTAINAYYNVLNKGTLTRVSKEKVADSRLSGIIEQAATDQGKSGTLKSWMITDMPKLLRLCEEHVRSQRLAPPKPSERVKAQLDYLGYIEPLGSDGRGLLYVTSDVRILKSKKTGKPWAYGFTAISLIDGSSREWTIRDGAYLEQLNIGDIVEVVAEDRGGKPDYRNSWGRKEFNGRDYFYLYRYRLAAGM